MAKSRRLFELVTLLRGRRTAVTARTLAEVLEVSERTIYRDMDTLVAAGVAVDGEAGVGYRLRPGSHLPPLMFGADEAMAIVLGLSIVRATMDPKLAAAAEGAERRIRAVLPDDVKRALEHLPYHMPKTARSQNLAEMHAALRQSATEFFKVAITYSDQAGMATERVIWPLAILGWGDRWTVLGWCELRNDYRQFRLDRIVTVSLLDQRFETSTTLSYDHFVKTRFGDGDSW